jgi:MFS transporter, ACS family, aldohexuronate transporter
VPGRAATALGIMDTGFAISGFLAPVITGWVVGTFQSFEYAFLLMAGSALSSVLVVLIFHRPDEDRADQPGGVAQATPPGGGVGGGLNGVGQTSQV